MNNKMKKFTGIAAALIILLVIPMIGEARQRSHRHSNYNSHNRHSTWRHGFSTIIPNIRFSPRYYGHSQPRPYIRQYQHYDSSSMWDQGYRDGYRQGRRDAARYSRNTHQRYYDRDFDYRYPGNSAYRQGFRAGYSEGLDNYYDNRSARRDYYR